MRELTYQISREDFNKLLAGRKDKKSNPYNYVKDIINNEFGLYGVVTHLTVI